MNHCTSCALRKQNLKCGRYNMRCIRCCGHLIRSARPLKHAQEAMFAAIERHEGAPTKAEIIGEIRAIDQQAQEGGAT